MLFPDAAKRISAFLPMTYAVDFTQGTFAETALACMEQNYLSLGHCRWYVQLSELFYTERKTGHKAMEKK